MPNDDTSQGSPFGDIAKKIKALDNEVKLRILHLLANEGEKSITDISKTLRINFSTTHKYLEQMEAAGVLTSHQVKDDRSKRLFKVKNYKLDLTPSHLMEHYSTKPVSNLKVLDWCSRLRDFDETKFINSHVEKGIPLDLLKHSADTMNPNMYNEMSILELENSLYTYLRSKQEQLNRALEIVKTQGLYKKGSFACAINKQDGAHILKDMVGGKLHINNLGPLKLLNFSHDLHLIDAIGYSHKPKTLPDFLNQISLIAHLKMYGAKQACDSFNYFIAPYAKGLSEKEIVTCLRTFFTEISDLEPFIGLDIGTPKFFSYVNMSAFDYTKPIDERSKGYLGSLYSGESYLNYKDSAANLAQVILSISKEFPKVKVLCKFWKDWEKFNMGMVMNGNVRICNMRPDWQTDNATYVDGTRFDASWKHWYRTVRVGEIQSVCINAPRLALESKNESAFFENLDTSFDNVLSLLHIGFDFINRQKHDKKLILGATPIRAVSKYTHYDDSLFSVALCGVEDAAKIMANGYSKDLMSKIIDYSSKRVNKLRQSTPLRIALKENSSALIRNRFHALDQRLFNVSLEPYCTGFAKSNWFSTHKLLTGGHSGVLDKGEINLSELLKTDFGLVKVR